MKVLPRPNEWDSVLLLPFKLYIALAWIFVEAYLHEAGRRWDSEDFVNFQSGYLICVFVLTLGGIVQGACGRTLNGLISLIMALVGIVIFFSQHIFPLAK